ncbi:MAG: uroporphyrinogen-III synthase [Sulfuricurvum sp.]|uniref:uroporphyrinogen-III synthase n=1 Tax=Sulfuricurvum sp. TaxID=2025608 RepID=UPI00261DBC52|nr:uroporphyrinogen-III synthase [Sulfuricurvum sp.]MDD2368149.1 uroporphyrinogen-III synthase [Sulfuricurvum sp.]MDD2951163.1 uroporphyrinogen-III synthase [Sulfuricurvum sp.]MDD5118451.1 uroporphyrinogen-III synthase [Sulfuricurvum sp.]
MRPVYLISKTPYAGVIHIPILTISFLNPAIDFAQYEGIILTSKQALVALENYTFAWENLQCICVSESTAEAARQAGAVHIEVGNGYAKSIPDVLRSKKRFGKWLYLRPKVIASEWVEKAREEGVVIDEAVVYETTCNQDAKAFSISEDAVLVFTSPSSIECFCASYSILPSNSIVAIGKTTQNAFKNAKEVFVSPEASVASAVQLAQEIAQNSSPF